MKSHLKIYDKIYLYYNCEKYPLSPLKPRGLAFLHDTYLTIEVQGIRCTNHLHDSCPLTDVNPHFTAPGCRYFSKLTADGLLWRHRHMGQTLAIVTSQWPTVPTGIYGRTMLMSARVKGIAITYEAMNCLAHDFMDHHFAYRGRMIHCSLRHTWRPNNLYTVWVKKRKIHKLHFLV